MMSMEDAIRQIVREELQKVLAEFKKELQQHQYDPVLKPEEAAKILKRGKGAIYELVNHDPTFPHIRINDRGDIRIPTKPFLEWIEKHHCGNPMTIMRGA